MTPNTEKPADRFLTAKEVSELIGFSVKAIWKGEGALATLTPIKIGKRSVRYSQSQVLEWMEAQKKQAEERRSVPATTNNVVEFVPTRTRQHQPQRQRAKEIRAKVLRLRSNND